MEFDANKFTGAHFQRREQDVPVPDLAAWFKGVPEGEEPVWRVRGLTAAELGAVNEAQQRNKNRQAIAEGLMSGKDTHLTEAIQELLGNGGSVPDDIAKRIEMLVVGSVNPECSHQLALKLSEAFPIEFYTLTTKITELTGLGSEVGKPKRSSSKQTSR